MTSIAQPVGGLSSSNHNIYENQIRAHYELGFFSIPICSPEPHVHHVNGVPVPCKSPGKAPHVPGWSRIARTSVRVRDSLKLFTQHPDHTNIGVALRGQQIVLDVDARSGGITSLESLFADHGVFPETPHAITGGGGHHYYFTLPEGVSVGGGGDLGPDYPGLEYKAAGGQVVAPPSRHVSGRSYQWAAEEALGEVHVSEIPTWLLEIIQTAATSRNLVGTPGQRRPKRANGRPSRYTVEEIYLIFNQTYLEGARRVPSGLPRLTGVLHSRGVCQDCCTRFLQWWQQDHYLPALPTEEIDEQIASMYRRWGEPRGQCQHTKHPLLRDVTASIKHHAGNAVPHDHEGHPNADTHQTPSPVVIDIEAARTARERLMRSELAQTRTSALYIARARFSYADVEECPSSQTPGHRGTFLDISGTASPIVMHNSSHYPSLEELRAWVMDLEGEEVRAARRLETCGWGIGLVCHEHGERRKGRSTCKTPYHGGCPTRSSQSIRLLELPDHTADDGGGYREVWIRTTIDASGYYPHQISDNIRADQQRFQDALATAARWKQYRGPRSILHRASSYWMARPYSFAFHKFMIDEDSEGHGDRAVEHVTRALGSTAAVVADRKYQSGETAVLQLYEDSMTSLAGVYTTGPDGEEDDYPVEYLFGGYYYATKGRKVFHGLGKLWSMLAAIPAEPAPVCDICGAKLRGVLKQPEHISESSDAGAPESRAPPRQYALGA